MKNKRIIQLTDMKDYCRRNKLTLPVFNIVSDRRGIYSFPFFPIVSLVPAFSPSTVILLPFGFFFYFLPFFWVRHTQLGFAHTACPSALQGGAAESLCTPTFSSELDSGC